MWLFACCCCICPVVLFLVIVTHFAELLDEWNPFDRSDSLNPLNASNCISKARVKNSCCYLNPIIVEQMRTIEGNIISRLSNKDCGLGPGLPNLGSKYFGSSIAGTRDTVPYKHPKGTSNPATNTPENVIDTAPLIVGKNWHFSGVGALIVKLFEPAFISGFTIVHPAACQVPKGYEKSAPRDFFVVGMNDINEETPFHFGNFTYDTSKNKAAQSFAVQFCSMNIFQLIEFRFLSNHGNPDYTALYRVQIHGDMGPPPTKNKTSLSPKDDNETV